MLFRRGLIGYIRRANLRDLEDPVSSEVSGSMGLEMVFKSVVENTRGLGCWGVRQRLVLTRSSSKPWIGMLFVSMSFVVGVYVAPLRISTPVSLGTNKAKKPQDNPIS